MELIAANGRTGKVKRSTVSIEIFSLSILAELVDVPTFKKTLVE